MNYLEPDAIQAINEIVVEESGGSVGVREYGLLESIVAKPQTSYGSIELYGNKKR